MISARLSLLLDPWPPEYDSALQVEEAAASAAARVDTAVETAVWAAIRPPPCEVQALHFVDGVRRIDARVVAQEGSTIVYGLFGALAAGAVRCDGAHACFDALEVRRVLILGNGRRQDDAIEAGGTLIEYEGVASACNTPSDLVNDLQGLMRAAEVDVAERLLAAGAHVFADGPLTYFPRGAQWLAGIVKRLHLPYLEPVQFALAAALVTGERTPLFLIDDGREDRYSWFVRLAAPRAVDHPLAGVIRVEVRAAAGREAAAQIADLSAAALPRFASHRARDARAPQNLVPVGALEEQLKHRLGDPLLIQRAIESRIAAGVSG